MTKKNIKNNKNKFWTKFISHKPKHTKDVADFQTQHKKSNALHFYRRKKKINLIIWSLIFIEPVSNVLAFLYLYLFTEQQTVGIIGLYTSGAILAAYAIAYIPIILSNKIWTYRYQGSLVIVYIGIIRCHLVIDEYLWDKKPKKITTYLYGVINGDKIEVCKNGGTCQISIDKNQKPITPVI